MVRKLLGLAALAGVAALAVLWWRASGSRIADSALAPHTPDLANGRTMFNAGGCASCHKTPNQDDGTRLGGGLALNSPYGAFHVPNISPDRADGIGAWSEADFVTAMVKGTAPDGTHYYPAFPYTSFQRMRLEDVRDLFAYLKTLPAVAGRIRDHALRFPFNIRATLGVWKWLYLDGKPFVVDATQSAAWNRGAYLVNAPSHCAECHSPRNVLGAVIESRRYTGGPSPSGKGGSPDITQGKLKKWTVEDFVEVLATGMTPDSDFVGGEMTEVVRNTSQLSQADREAMAVYLKALPAAPQR